MAKLYRENDYKGIKRINKKDRNQAQSPGQQGSGGRYMIGRMCGMQVAAGAAPTGLGKIESSAEKKLR